ncbi:CobW family GTP-binding protein [Nocardioides zeae]
MTDLVPVLVVAGPLGAGKTTLVNHLLSHSADTRVGVIVNDFGDIDVDGLLVAGQADMLFSASGGCLCCATDDGAVADFVARLTAPRAGIDVVVVEASGVADPVALVHRVTSSLSRRARFGGLVVLLDAEHVAPDLTDLAEGVTATPSSCTRTSWCSPRPTGSTRATWRGCAPTCASCCPAGR